MTETGTKTQRVGQVLFTERMDSPPYVTVSGTNVDGSHRRIHYVEGAVAHIICRSVTALDTPTFDGAQTEVELILLENERCVTTKTVRLREGAQDILAAFKLTKSLTQPELKPQSGYSKIEGLLRLSLQYLQA